MQVKYKVCTNYIINYVCHYVIQGFMQGDLQSVQSKVTGLLNVEI
jgi:hypothetical protein